MYAFALRRIELKRCWESLRFFLDNMLLRISKMRGVSYEKLFYYYTTRECRELLFNKKKIKTRNRERHITFVFHGGKIVLYEGQEAKKLQLPIWKQIKDDQDAMSGNVAYPGIYTGCVVIGPHADVRALNNTLFQEGEILVTTMTQPNMVLLAKKAGAIITDEGGIASHAAILAREFRIPTIVGTGVATQKLKTGDLVEVDANNGIVKIL
jgi:phosphohistidine swiveling domain-containing protein